MSTGFRCQQCEAPVMEGALFCSKCGADVTALHGPDSATLEVTAVGTPVPRVQSTMRQILRDATLGEYEILSELGRGGMATVFLAHDISLDRKVAIKVMAPHLLEGEGMSERFKLEARTAAQLSHPHIIPIYAVKETESTLFFVMKFVEGKPLDDIIKKMGQLPIPMVKDILTKVGSALGYAHRRGVVHRDVKPANVMIDEEGTPIVTDFGIAKVAEAKGLTMTGTTIGTPTYMSPEQCEAKEVTGSSDQYSLGVVAWEMLTGSAPFAGDSAVTTMYKHCHEPLPPLQDFRPDSPAEVLETVTRMLSKAPSERWPSLEAAMRKLGPATQDQLDPIRRELLELARDTDARELIAQLSTPRSPMPGVRTGGRTAARTAGVAAAEPAPARRSWFPMVAASAVVIAAVGGALAVLQPWAPEGMSSAVESPGAPVVDGGDRQGGDGAGGSESGGGQVAGVQTNGASGGATTVDVSAGVQPTPGGASAGGSPAGVSTTPPANPAAGSAAGGGAAGRGTTQPPAQPRVASVRIEGAQGALEPGDRVTLSATPLTDGGGPMRGGPPRWSSSPAFVGSVDQNGVFTALASGSATVTAQIDGANGTATITVGAARVADLSVTPTDVTLVQGETAALRAQARARGNELIEADIAWQSDAPEVATVAPNGQVRAVGAGSATITASAGGTSRRVSVTVTPPPIDTRTAIEELIAIYARALESGDIAAVRRAYPGMTAEQERNFGQSLPNIERANLSVLNFSDQGNSATATVRGTYGFLNNGRRTTSEPFEFRATFRRAGNGWELALIQ
jgi:serine/threonine-protein kinase